MLFGVGVILFRNIPILDACLLLGYGTATNYSCVWIGVFLDYKMPRTPNSTNELLHGNISKVLVLFVSIALTVWEIYFSTQISGSISLLLICSLYKCLHCYDRAWIFDILQEGLS